MRLTDLLRLAWGQVRRGRVRSLLCGGTVAVGVCAMAVIGAIGTLAQTEMHTAVRAIGLRGMTCYLENRRWRGFDTGFCRGGAQYLSGSHVRNAGQISEWALSKWPP